MEIWKMTMRQTERAVRRSRGRPRVRPDEETRQLVLAVARQEFLASGYAGASIVAVAQRAGVTTKTTRPLPLREATKPHSCGQPVA
jgi:AcrR family transcriptional regulator